MLLVKYIKIKIKLCIQIIKMSRKNKNINKNDYKFWSNFFSLSVIFTYYNFFQIKPMPQYKNNKTNL